MHINLIDPGLHKLSGHNFDWNRKIVQHLVKTLGHTVVVYCAKDCAQQVLAGFPSANIVVPCFTHRSNMADDVHPFQQFAEELAQVGAADYWLFPTLTQYQLRGLVAFGPAAPVGGCIHRPGNREHFINAVGLAAQSDTDIKLVATTPGLASLFSQPGMEVRVAPIYYDSVVPRAVQPRQNFERIGIFGSQRIAKGADFMMPLVDSLLQAGLQVTLQDSNALYPLDEQKEGLRLLHFADDLAAEIATCDAVLLPYDPDIYRIAMSGIQIEALALGIPVVAPENTYSGRLTTHWNSGTLFEDFDLYSMVKAVNELKAIYPQASQGAYEASQKLAANHGAGRFTEALLAR